MGVDLPPPHLRLSTLPEGRPELTLGEGAVAWAMAYLYQPNGPRAGLPWRPTRDQYRFLLWWYALDRDGQWLFQHAARRLSKGSGKSPFAAVLALIEFLGPVRLERFDDRLPGGCRGKAVDMPLVQIAATAESQTDNTMKHVRAFCRHKKATQLRADHNLDPGKTQIYTLPEGTLQVITSSAIAAEGAESTFCVGDETEHWLPTNGGAELHSTLADNLAKSGNRMVETANAWKPGVGSAAEATWDSWMAQQEGRTRGEGATLYDARLAPPDTDMSDEKSLQSALEWVYGDCDWKRPHAGDPPEPDMNQPPDVRPMMLRIWDPRSAPDDSARKYLNWPTVDHRAWTTPQEWALLADLDRVVEPGEEIAMFFDGSLSDDHTALVGCCISDGHVFLLGHWDPQDYDGTVPTADIDVTVRRAFQDYDVAGFFADVNEWTSFAKISWPEDLSDGLRVWAQPSGNELQAIAWDMRSKTRDFTLEAELVLAEILAEGFTHDGNPILARHVANMRRSPNRHGVSVAKESPKSPNKIDAGVCMIGARLVRRRVIAEAAKTPKRKKAAGRVVGWS